MSVWKDSASRFCTSTQIPWSTDWKPGSPKFLLGDYLGDMTNALEDKGYITEFVSGSLKNYGYTTSSDKVCCKVRGSHQLNYEVMRQNVEINKKSDASQTWRTLHTTPHHKEKQDHFFALNRTALRNWIYERSYISTAEKDIHWLIIAVIYKLAVVK